MGFRTNSLYSYHAIIKYISDCGGAASFKEMINNLAFSRKHLATQVNDMIDRGFLLLVDGEEKVLILNEKGHRFLNHYPAIKNFSVTFGLL